MSNEDIEILASPPESQNPVIEPEDKPDYDPVAECGDEFERLLGAPHSTLEKALLSHSLTLDRLFHRLAMCGAGSQAQGIDKTVMELALQTQAQFRRCYKIIKDQQKLGLDEVETYYRKKAERQW